MAGLIEVRRNCCCSVSVEWIVLCLSMFFKTFTKRAFSKGIQSKQRYKLRVNMGKQDIEGHAVYNNSMVNMGKQ